MRRRLLRGGAILPDRRLNLDVAAVDVRCDYYAAHRVRIDDAGDVEHALRQLAACAGERERRHQDRRHFLRRDGERRYVEVVAVRVCRTGFHLAADSRELRLHAGAVLVVDGLQRILFAADGDDRAELQCVGGERVRCKHGVFALRRVCRAERLGRGDGCVLTELLEILPGAVHGCCLDLQLVCHCESAVVCLAVPAHVDVPFVMTPRRVNFCVTVQTRRGLSTVPTSPPSRRKPQGAKP